MATNRQAASGGGRLAQGLIALLALALAGCASGPTDRIDLMPAPEAFDNGAINPLPENDPIKDLPYGGVLYATDRAPAAPGGAEPYYSSERGLMLRLGAAQLEVGDTNITWEEARRISLLKNRPSSYPIKVSGVSEFGVLASTVNPLIDPRDVPADPAGAARKFADAIDAKLKTSRIKDVFIYVHGYKVAFENPALVASEFWHFLGYQGVFIAYSWPATPKATAYLGDIDTAAGMARNLRELVTFIENDTQAEHVHIIGYSAGTRLVSRALEQMALINRDAPAGAPRRGRKLANVILVGSDVDRAVFGAYLADDIIQVSQHLTIYGSSADKALRMSRLLTGHTRLGMMWGEGEMPASVKAYFDASEARLSFIDVAGASNSTSENGHAYFRASPWVSSDILMTLAYRLQPAERGLVRADTGVWTFPTDYVARMTRALAQHIRRPPGS